MKTVAIYDECYNINTENNIRSFLKLPTILLTDETLKELSPEAKLLYTILCNLTSLSSKNGWFDENGNIYVRYSVKKTGETLGCKKDKAMKVLKSRLLEAKMQEQTDAMAQERKTQVGTGDRSERIRTYNYPQGRRTDHRIGLTLYRLDDILNGNIDEVIDALITADRAAKLENSMEGRD